LSKGNDQADHRRQRGAHTPHAGLHPTVIQPALIFQFLWITGETWDAPRQTEKVMCLVVSLYLLGRADEVIE
jgi:hypothetical protein